MPRTEINWPPILTYVEQHPDENGASIADRFGVKVMTLRAKLHHARKESPAPGVDPATAAAVYVRLSVLRPWGRNPKPHEDVSVIVASIIRFGFGNPLLARLEDQELIAGHGRIKAVGLLPRRYAAARTALEKADGAEKAEAAAARLAAWHPEAVILATAADPVLPVRYRDLSVGEAHALALVDNQAAAVSGFDDALLAEAMREIAGWGSSLEDLGWDADAIGAYLCPPIEHLPGGGGALPGNDGPRHPWPSDWPPPIASPYPWFGGKLRAAPLIWTALGVDVPNYVEPFLGSCATLLARPPGTEPRTETVNDVDAFVSNFWRAVTLDPEATADAADWPVSEADLSARHLWLVAQRRALTERLQVDPDAFDAKIAGWWVWGICSWIGSGWCSGEGPWTGDDGAWIDRRTSPPSARASTGSSPTSETQAGASTGSSADDEDGDADGGVGNAGQGINRQLPHLSTFGQGINRQLPHLGNAGRGINRKLPHLGDGARTEAIHGAFAEIAERLRGVRVACGDWRRVLSESVTVRHGITGILLDPPYPDGFSADGGAYSAGDAGSDVWHEAAAWAVENGGDLRLRIVLCGYAGTWNPPPGWREIPWKARGGYGSSTTAGAENSGRERLWLSPGCLDVSAVADG